MYNLLNRNFHKKPLLKLELVKLAQRIDDINNVLDATDDEDICYNLEAELDCIIEILNKSLKATKARRIGLKLVG